MTTLLYVVSLYMTIVINFNFTIDFNFILEISVPLISIAIILLEKSHINISLHKSRS